MTNPKPTRRDVLRVATGIAGAAAVVGAVGTAAYMVPLLDQTDTDVAMPAVAGTVDVDLVPLLPGQQVDGVLAIVADLRGPSKSAGRDHVAQFRPAPASCPTRSPSNSSNRPMPATRSARSKLGSPCWWASAPTWVAPRNSIRSPMPVSRRPIGSAATSAPATARNTIWRAAWSKDSPAPYNLPVPPHHFVGDKVVRIGENPPNVKFDFNTIQQI